LKFIEPLSNKLEMIRHGNSKSFNDHPELVKKAMNKEDCYSHLVPIDVDICRASAYLCHTIQTVVIKPGKNDHIVWDGTTTLLALDRVMNQVTPVNREAPITFGHVKNQLYIDIYNTHISHPYVVILLDGRFWIHGRRFLQLSYGYGDGIWIYYLRDQLGAVSTRNRGFICGIC
jgi:hypothetical protein